MSGTLGTNRFSHQPNAGIGGGHPRIFWFKIEYILFNEYFIFQQDKLIT